MLKKYIKYILIVRNTFLYSFIKYFYNSKIEKNYLNDNIDIFQDQNK